MIREFVYTSIYLNDYKNLNIDDEINREIENMLLQNPQIGDVIPNLNGARKVRIAINGKGKRGGGRVIYLDMLQKRANLFTASIFKK